MFTRERPVLVYDGDCGICTRSVEFVERRLRTDVEIVAFQFADLASLGLTREACEDAVQWVTPSGRISHGHIAVGDLLKASGWPWVPIGWLVQTPPTSWIAGAAYRWVARNRHRLPGGTPACTLPAEQRPGTGTRLPSADGDGTH